MSAIQQHLEQLTLLSELHGALMQMLAHDHTYLVDDRPWMRTITTLQHGFAAPLDTVMPFNLAWRLMYAAICRLDKIQDGDPLTDAVFAALPPPQQYNQIFGYYILASSLLNELRPPAIPYSRITALHRLWSEMLLRMASGQQRDISVSVQSQQADPLAYYQEIAQFKTGATFALAFGGTAALNTDDTVLIETLTIVGEIYGTLLQYSDDLVDHSVQPNETMTFPSVLQSVLAGVPADSAQRTADAFFRHVYRLSLEQTTHIIASVPVPLREAISDIFRETFGSELAQAEVQ